MVDLAASPTAEHAATLLDGHARLREASAFIAGTVPHREKHGGGRIAYDRWGPRVRKFFYLDSNSWIVTILPPKRNLVPRFRRKMPNQKEVGNSYTLV